MDQSILMIVLFGALGVFLGSMRSRHITSDLLVLGVWAVFFIINPSAAMGVAIGGYLVGWAVRCLRAKMNQGDKPE